MNKRYYNPKIAGFLSEDSYRGDRKDPLSLNLYTYCHNEPVMYVNPDGHWEIITKNGRVYAVAQKGDTLSGLAKQQLGSSNKWKQLGYSVDPSKLKVGQMIDITKIDLKPATSKTATSTTTAGSGSSAKSTYKPAIDANSNQGSNTLPSPTQSSRKDSEKIDEQIHPEIDKTNSNGNGKQKESDSIWTSPVEQGKITSQYGYRVIDKKEEYHSGIDYGIKKGTPVYAVIDGELQLMEASRDKKGELTSYGYHIRLTVTNESIVKEHGEVVIIYAHLSEDTLKLYGIKLDKESGENSTRINTKIKLEVKKGELIGYSGSTGRSSGPHLHFEIRAGQSKDSLKYNKGEVDKYNKLLNTDKTKYILNTVDPRKWVSIK